MTIDDDWALSGLLAAAEAQARLSMAWFIFRRSFDKSWLGLRARWLASLGA